MLGRAVVVAVLAITILCCTPAAEPAEPLKLGVLPAMDAESTQDTYEVLAGVLGRTLERPVKLAVAPSYDALQKDLASGRVHLAQLSAYLHVLSEHGKHHVLVQERLSRDLSIVGPSWCRPTPR